MVVTTVPVLMGLLLMDHSVLIAQVNCSCYVTVTHAYHVCVIVTDGEAWLLYSIIRACNTYQLVIVTLIKC